MSTNRNETSVRILRALVESIREAGPEQTGEFATLFEALGNVFEALADQWGQGDVTPLVMANVVLARALAEDLEISCVEWEATL